MEKRPLVFVSYRRDDSRGWAELVVDSLQRHFGQVVVFLDRGSIKAGDKWQENIATAIQEATVVLVVIGPQWLSQHDDSWRRRIDLAGDWVRREIETALTSGKPLIPVLLPGARIPRVDELPAAISELANHQPMRLEEKADIRALVGYLSDRFGFRSITGELDYPSPHDSQPELPEEELVAALRRLPEWSRTERDSARGNGGMAVALERVYRFKTFDDAIHFMATTARYIRVTNHHPRWENQYNAVRVSITTWDVGLRITWKDVQLAEYLDRQYQEYVVYDMGGRATEPS